MSNQKPRDYIQDVVKGGKYSPCPEVSEQETLCVRLKENSYFARLANLGFGESF